VPDDGTLQSHREFIKTLPATDQPEAFGQHANADIAFQLSDSYLILMTIAGLQKSAGGSKAGSSVEENVLSICNDLLLQVKKVWAFLLPCNCLLSFLQFCKITNNVAFFCSLRIVILP
jgi:hypothetical protein